MSAANIGTRRGAKGHDARHDDGPVSLDAQTGNAAARARPQRITSINVLADGKGGFTFTDQNNQALSATAVNNLFGGASATTGTGTALTLKPQGALTGGASTSQTASIAAIQASNTQVTAGGFKGSATTLSTISITGTLNSDLGKSTGTAIAKIAVKADGAGGYTFSALDASNNDITSSVTDGTNSGSAALATMFSQGTASGTTPASLALSSTGKGLLNSADQTSASTAASTAVAANYVAPTYQQGLPKNGDVLGSVTFANPLKVTAGVAAEDPTGNIKSIQASSNGSGGVTYKAFDSTGTEIDMSGVTIGGSTGSAGMATLFQSTAGAGGSTQLSLASSVDSSISGDTGVSFSAINAKSTPAKLGTVSVNLNAKGDAVSPGDATSFSSVNVYADGSGGYKFVAVGTDGTESTDAAVNAEASNLFSAGTTKSGSNGFSLSGAGSLAANSNATQPPLVWLRSTANNVPPKVSDIDISDDRLARTRRSNRSTTR